MKRIKTGLLVLGLMAMVVGVGMAGARSAVGALVDGLGLRDRLLEHVTKRMAAFHGDPVGGIMKGLETHLGLSDDQKTRITPLLTALHGKIKADMTGAGPRPLDPERLQKFANGTLTVEDVKAAMKARQDRMAAREADVIDTVQAVYSLLDPTQRRITANLLRRRLERAREADPLLKLGIAARVLGIADAQVDRIWSIVQPVVSEVRTQALAAADEFKDLPTVIESGKLTTADLHKVVDRRKALVKANEEKIATAIHQVIGTLTADQRQQALALAQRLRPQMPAGTGQ